MKSTILKLSNYNGGTGKLDGDQSNIFSEYGSGIEAYFKFLKNLIWIYAGLSLLIVPVAYLYSRGDGLSGIENPSFVNKATLFTLGNLGFAESLCYN